MNAHKDLHISYQMDVGKQQRNTKNNNVQQ